MAYRAIGPQRSSAGIPLTQLLPESASHAELPGALVLIDANGNVDACGADPTAVYGVQVGTGHNNGTAAVDYVEVHRIVPGAEYDGILKGTLAATDVGEAFGVVRHTDAVWVIDRSDTTNDVVVITGIPSTSTVGGVDQVVTFQFLTAIIQTP